MSVSYASNVYDSNRIISEKIQDGDFPSKEWSIHSRVGWSVSKLVEAQQFVCGLKTSAYMVIQSGKIVDQWGDVTTPWKVHSVRKSFLNALYGIFEYQGVVKLETTLKDLRVDDNEPSLTETEKLATLDDLLNSRSGIYHPAAYETASMKAARPLRGSHLPGEFWYYNNWDFNALGGILEKLTGFGIFQLLEVHLAKPLGMQDFKESDGKYDFEPDSNYPAYDFSMSARDMARFGHLYLRQGRWGSEQIIPEDWVKKSTSAISSRTPTETNPFTGYGKLWWIGDDGYLALGYGGHMIAVIPSKDMVIIHRVSNDNDEPEQNVTGKDLNHLLKILIDAAP